MTANPKRVARYLAIAQSYPRGSKEQRRYLARAKRCNLRALPDRLVRAQLRAAAQSNAGAEIGAAASVS